MGVYDHLVEKDRVEALQSDVIREAVAYVEHFFPSDAFEGDDVATGPGVNLVRAVRKLKEEGYAPSK